MFKPPLGIDEIQKLLPHRYPMLLVDRVVSYDRSTEIVLAEKLVSGNEPFLPGHFPGQPLMPGVLMIEALAQTACIGLKLRRPDTIDRLVVLVGVNKARFRKPVGPGDVLQLEAFLKRARGAVAVADCTARVMGDIVAECQVMAGYADWTGERP